METNNLLAASPLADIIAQDLRHWAAVIFACAVLAVAASFIDMWTGIEAARANRERVSSKALRKTVAKIIDYLRVVLFALLIDALGVLFPWYVLPYCVVLCTLGILLIEGKSVIENSRRKKSNAGEILDAVQDIIKAASEQDAERIIDKLKGKEGEK